MTASLQKSYLPQFQFPFGIHSILGPYQFLVNTDVVMMLQVLGFPPPLIQKQRKSKYTLEMQLYETPEENE